MSKADILKKLATRYVKPEAIKMIEDLERRLEVAVANVDGRTKCPACGETSVVCHSDRRFCLMCDWEHAQ